MKIKMSEVIAQRDSLKSSISQTKSQLSSAKKKLKSAANSEALKGDVKDAIDNKITNYQVPLLTNYVNSLDVISQGYDNLISTFKSIVSENSDSAIIDTDVLQQMVDKFDSPLEQLKASSDAINKAIDDVADIVTLTKVTTDDAISEFRGAKKVLTNTIKDMGTFNNTVFTSEAGDILDEQNAQITSLSDLGSSSYTSKKAKDFYKKTAFKTEVKETKLVVSGKARRDQLKNELAKNLYDSKYSGYMMEASLPTATLLTLRKKGGDYYEEFQKVMDSDTAKYLSEAFKLLPSKFIKSIKQSEGFKEIMWGLAKSGEKGEKAATYVLKGLMKYEEFGNAAKNTKLGAMIAGTSKVFDGAKKVADPLKSIAKEGLKSTKFYKAISETAKTGGEVSGTFKILGKGVKFAGKAATVVTFADVAVSGVSGGAKEFAKTKDIGKGVIVGTFSAVKSVGPLEGATIGAAVGGGFPGAVVGAGVGLGIYILDKTGVLDTAEDLTMKFYDKTKENIGKTVKTVGKSISTKFSGIGKAVGVG
ncbi:MAG: LXG domain-containing protein [Streptococcus sp.]|nr:T7SS effector LXG polymorphic toxin [Streptococcus sp.]MCR5492625.1 LXG domain-containing protein [Streptococcus sp.]